MFRLLTCSFLLLLSLQCCSESNTSSENTNPEPPVQSKPCTEVSPKQIENIKAILTENTGRYSDYPIPPTPTCPIMIGLVQELRKKEVEDHFQLLGPNTFNQVNQEAMIRFFRENKLRFCLLALVVHSNPDIRIRATEALLQFDLKDQTTLAFLIHVIENTPEVISGSENSTIHGIWIDKLVQALNRATGESYELSYQAGQNLSTGISIWKKHLKQP